MTAKTIAGPGNATPNQFSRVLLRMMPTAISSMGEGQLVAAIFGQAWGDARNSVRARQFFMQPCQCFDRLCEGCGLDATQVRAMYVKHNMHHADHLPQESQA